MKTKKIDADSDKAAAKARNSSVEADNGQNGYCPKPINLRSVGRLIGTTQSPHRWQTHDSLW
jgi:hypothetical protein